MAKNHHTFLGYSADQIKKDTGNTPYFTRPLPNHNKVKDSMSCELCIIYFITDLCIGMQVSVSGVELCELRGDARISRAL